MGALDPVKILAVLVIALIVLGPEKLPRVARQLGAAWHELTKFRDKVEQEVREAMPDLDLPRIPPRPGAAIAGFVADLTAPIKAGPQLTGSGEGDGNGAGADVGPDAEPSAASVPAGNGAEPPPVAARPAGGGRAAAIAVDDPSMN